MDTNLIQIRRREVDAEITRLEARLADMRNELADLDTAERVLSRLSGAKRSETRPADKPKPTVVPPETSYEPPLTEKIFTVLTEAYRRGLKGLEPSGIYDAIIAKDWTASKDAVRTTTWRLWNEDRLAKVPDTRLYSVLEKEKATDLLSSQEQSGAFDQNPAQGREAGPGGGA